MPPIGSARLIMLLRRAAFAAAILALGPALTARAQSPPPVFTEAACELPHVTPLLQRRLRCGTVTVPRDYAHPDAGTYRLAVVVIRSDQQPAAADPVLYVSGGPGGPLTTFASHQADHPIARGRDIILVDQRGTGHSEPRLCPSFESQFVGALVEAMLDPATEPRRRALFASCRDEAAARGIDLKDFGTVVTVRDFEQVRTALGIEQWNLFGVSYGTTAVMTMLALHPETARAAVLDSVNPPNPLLPPWSATVTDAVQAFLAACQADADCNALYPALPQTYRDTVAQLRNTPLPITLPPGLHRTNDHPSLTAGLFRFVVGRLVYDPNAYPGLPRLIARVHAGDTSDVVKAIVTLAAAAQDRETGANVPANAAIDCRDRPRFHEPLDPQADELDRGLNGICAEWAPLGPPPLVPIGSVVPTLVIAGQFDPNARLGSIRRIADLIGDHAQWIEVLGAGHSVRSSNACAASLVATFFDHPLDRIETSCASHPPPLRFTPP